MRIQNNVPALNAHRFYGINQAGVTKSIAKLSSGYRINSAADDAAGLAISEKMRAQIRGLTMASKNTQDGISLIQTAEGGLQEIDNMLQRIRELVVYASNDTQENNALGTGDRQKIQDEIDALVAEVDSMSERVEFNKKTLLNGSCGASTDPTKAASVSTARAAYQAAKANVGAYEAQIATDEKNFSDQINKINNLVGNIRTDALTLSYLANSAVQSEMADFESAVDNFNDALNALDLASDNGTAATTLIDDLKGALTSYVDKVADDLIGTAEADALRDKITK
jgi:flagellin